MESETSISRRRFVQVVAVACAAGIFAAHVALPRGIRSIDDVIAEDLAAGRSPRSCYAPRPDTLRGRTIAFLGTGSFNADLTFACIREHLERDLGCTVIGADEFPRGRSAIGADDNGIAQAMAARGVDAAIVGNGGCTLCATAVGRAAAQLELAGIPTVIVAERTYERELCAAFSSYGLPSQPTVSWYVPSELLHDEMDEAVLRGGMDALLRGLTSLDFAFREPGINLEA